MGIALIYQTATVEIMLKGSWFGLPYFSIALSLNVVLTLTIVIRLIVHTRNTRTALGLTGIGGMCKVIVTMLIESCLLYAVNSLLILGLIGTGIDNTFLPVLSETQVRPFPHPIFGQVVSCDDGLNRSLLHYSSFSESPTKAR